MAVIKLTEFVYENKEYSHLSKILFQTDRMIKCVLMKVNYKGEYRPCTRITHVYAMVDSFYCTESIEEIEKLILKSKQ